MVLDTLEFPIVLAPMAGGPSTVALAAAVSDAGGLGFLASGYRGAAELASDIGALRERSERRFGVNLFVPSAGESAPEAIATYLGSLAGEARLYGAELGQPRRDDDGWDAKLALIREQRPPVLSFTFGCPPPRLIEELRELDVEVWVTITTPGEAVVAEAAGVSALIVQGIEAGGHRGGFADPEGGAGFGVLALLRLVAAATRLPLVATGAIADGAALAAVLCAGASAGQIGSAFLLTPEAGTHPAHRQALSEGRPTALTRAFSGRQARGIVNRFLRDHTAEAPSGYPEIHHATSPLRAAARARGDADGFNLWAGQAHGLAEALPAREIVRKIGLDAAQILGTWSTGAGARRGPEPHAH